ncbi:cytochrome P450 [Roseibacterium sp. SDUM158016]|uniref:cytochrome P450 n=1 Tax=Roseicyclus sediminis TaxID=2980997 RepID=UPI0021CED724|nr:cytochrome P450 [Roseibacterium sp. SDUM158016]MCU4655061.1 cytochrome P450 [Roseibacterium sp. SDUM158016]
MPDTVRNTAESARLPVRTPLPDRPMGLIESYRTARRNLLEIIPRRALFQPVLSGRTGPQRWHMLMDPAGIRRVLLEAVEDYPKSVATRAVLKPAIGDSLFLAEGEEWRWQRRAAAPAFSARSVDALTPVMTRAAEAAATRLDASVGRAADMVAEMTAAAFDVIADVTFSDGKGIDRAGVVSALESYIDEAARMSLLDVLGVPASVPRPARALAARRLGAMQAEADAAIARRQAAGPGAGRDLLDRLIAAEDPETGRRMDADTLRETLLTFIVAGHETTALSLSWALYLCAFDTTTQDLARAEAQAILGDRAAGAADVPALPMTRAIVEEALRLYPPGAFLSRTARRSDRLGAAMIHPGDTVMIPVWALHRHRRLWENPDAFDPSRWLGETRPERWRYLPFGDGPRICIGMRFALQEATVILATLLARFHLAPVPGREPKPVMILTTRPEGGVWLEVSRA